jgi:hypothetical protein
MIDAGFNNEEELANFFDVSTQIVKNWKRNKHHCLNHASLPITPKFSVIAFRTAKPIRPAGSNQCFLA